MWRSASEVIMFEQRNETGVKSGFHQGDFILINLTKTLWLSEVTDRDKCVWFTALQSKYTNTHRYAESSHTQMHKRTYARTNIRTGTLSPKFSAHMSLNYGCVRNPNTQILSKVRNTQTLSFILHVLTYNTILYGNYKNTTSTYPLRLGL